MRFIRNTAVQISLRNGRGILKNGRQQLLEVQASIWLALSILALCFSLQLVCIGQVAQIRRVLVLNEVNASYPLIELVDRGIRSGLANSPYHLEFYFEYFDTTLFPDQPTQQEFRDFYLRKYQRRRPDVIITVGPSPLKFMAELHQRFFPGVPVVFCVPNHLPGTLTLDSDFTGVEGDIAPALTLNAALRLRPDTKHVVVVTGVAPFDRQREAAIEEQLKAYKDHLDISYLTDLSMPDLLEHLRHLPDQTVVILSTISLDAAGTRFKSSETSPLVVAAANAPVFSLSDMYLNHGEVGGAVASVAEEGKMTGQVALRILNGERPQDIHALKNATRYMFDWRALQRWGLKEKDLPAGSIVLNRDLSFWDAFKWYIMAGIIVLFAQTVAIVGLVWQRARRKKAEAQLRRSEDRFSKSFRRSPLAVTITNASVCAFIEVNETFEQQTGWRRDEVIGRTSSEIGLWAESDQRSAFRKQLLVDGNISNCEVKVRRRDGQIRTALVSAEIIELNGEQCALAVTADVTERQEAEEALAGVSGKLIAAHEEERTRIARELHDDINQRLALVAVNLKNLKQDLPASEFKACSRIEQISQSVHDLVSDVQALSHRLHSSKLDYLGLEAASASFCKELSEQQHVEINFHTDGVPEILSSEISLSLFRVLQEALHNAVKYSGVRQFEVSLTGTSYEIQLVIRDDGIGFNLDDTKRQYGLGLASMKERLKLVHGTLSIDSKPQRGTTILACVPFAESRMASTGAVA
jgi:PAS domain S-box-containing protein